MKSLIIYSIWICLNVPKEKQNTINEYSITERNIVGNVKEDKRNYDLSTVVMIYLGNPETASSNELLKMLDTVFDPTEDVTEKIKTLNQEFGIKMSQGMKEEVETVNNLGLAMFERGEEQGEVKAKVNNILSLMKTLKFSVIQAMNALEIPENEQKNYEELVNDELANQ